MPEGIVRSDQLLLRRWNGYEYCVNEQMRRLSTRPWLKASVELLESISSRAIVWAMQNHRQAGREAFIPVIPIRRFDQSEMMSYLNLIPFQNRQTTIPIDLSWFARTTRDEGLPYYLLDVNPETNFFTCPTSGRLPTGRRYLNISEAIALAIHLRDRRMLRTGGFWAGAAEEQFGSGPNAYTYPYVKWGRVGGEGSIHCDKSTPPDQGVYWPTSSVVSLHR